MGNQKPGSLKMKFISGKYDNNDTQEKEVKPAGIPGKQGPDIREHEHFLSTETWN